MTEFSVSKITGSEWDHVARPAHMTVFGEDRPVGLNRHHFVITVVLREQLAGYFTCLEMDSETLYIQHGGVFPNFANSIYVLPGYQNMILWCRQRYKRVWTRVESANQAMLKMAMKLGFKTVGTWCFRGKIYLELLLEF